MCSFVFGTYIFYINVRHQSRMFTMNSMVLRSIYQPNTYSKFSNLKLFVTCSGHADLPAVRDRMTFVDIDQQSIKVCLGDVPQLSDNNGSRYSPYPANGSHAAFHCEVFVKIPNEPHSEASYKS